jgi:hypothetical protein
MNIKSTRIFEGDAPSELSSNGNNHEDIQLGVSCSQAEIRSERPPSTSLERHPCTNLMGVLAYYR